MRLIEDGVNSVIAEAIGKRKHPRFVFLAVPGIGNEHLPGSSVVD
jgi:hypothetical protein